MVRFICILTALLLSGIEGKCIITELQRQQQSVVSPGHTAFDTVIVRDQQTEYMLNTLRALGKSDFMMFGAANALTISYSGGPLHGFTDQSDCKDITGSHPAFIESDFMWYINNGSFRQQDTTAMRIAYNRGAVCGYCFHLRGRYASTFYISDGPANQPLVKEIIASSDRSTNTSLDWYLDMLDQQVIPIVKGLGFPLIYRPFHEMNGDWFWWGSSCCTSAEYVQLYRLTVDYLRSKGVMNLLYAWSPNISTDMNYYPGDNYVDIIGYDGYENGVATYHTTANFTTNVGILTEYAATHDKVMAVTETGYGAYPDVHFDFWTNHILNPLYRTPDTRHVAWVMTWYNADWGHDGSGTSWIPYAGIDSVKNGQRAINDFVAFYHHPSTVFMDELPPFYMNSDSSAFVYPSEMTLGEGDSITLLGGLKCNWINDNVTWESGNPDMAVISANGTVKALGEGQTYLVMTASNGDKDTCRLKVNVGVAGVTIVPSSDTILIGEKIQLTAAISPDRAADKTAFWTSSNEKIATVDSTGLVTAISKGSSTITVQTFDGGYTATSKIRVVSASAIRPAESNSQEISIFPNPLVGKILTVDLGDFKGESTIRIIDISGQLVFEQKGIEKQVVQLETDLKPGLYIVEIVNAMHTIDRKLIAR
jgi:mannan endo-1,4-beta-mannosidase